LAGDEPALQSSYLGAIRDRHRIQESPREAGSTRLSFVPRATQKVEAAEAEVVAVEVPVGVWTAQVGQRRRLASSERKRSRLSNRSRSAPHYSSRGQTVGETTAEAKTKIQAGVLTKIHRSLALRFVRRIIERVT
jgi:hypothetical protein